MENLIDYMTEEQKKELASLCFDAFKKKILDYDLTDDVDRVMDGFVEHIITESTPDMLTDVVKQKLEDLLLSKIDALKG